MKIKKFRARNFAEALTLVKKELSENAVILSTEEKRGLRPFVEVTAAVDYDMECGGANPASGVNHRITDAQQSPATQSKGHASDDRPAPLVQESFAPGARGIAQESSAARYGSRRETLKPPLPDGRVTGEMRSQLEKLREVIAGIRGKDEARPAPSVRNSLSPLPGGPSASGDRRILTRELSRDLTGSAPAMASKIEVKDGKGEKRVFMLIGPTGVGKTTTVAKLSAKAMKDGKRVGIMSLDTYRIGAIEQMRIYARIMGIPLSVVATAAELREALPAHAASREVIFIDTPGRNPSDEHYISQLVEACGTAVPVEVHLLMSATSDYEYMVESYKSYRKVPIDCIGVTKVDEAVRFGSLYNFLLAHQKPVAYITTGQKVPDDIEFATSENFAQLILTKGCYRC